MALIWINSTDDVPRMLRWPLAFTTLKSKRAHILAPTSESLTGELTEALEARAQGLPAQVAAACDAEWGPDGWEARLDTEPSAAAEPDEASGAGGGDQQAGRVRVALTLVNTSDTFKYIEAQLAAEEHRLLCMVLAPGQPPKGELRDRWRKLLTHIRCELLAIRLGRDEHDDGPVIVPVSNGLHARFAMRLGADLTDARLDDLELVYVEPDLGSSASSVGRRILNRIGTKALGERFAGALKKVIVSDDLSGALIRERAERKAGIMIVGASVARAFSRQLTGATSERLLRSDESSTVAVARASLPLVGRWRRGLEDLLQRTVPQIEREARLDMVERVQSNSMWDFDFSSLMCLSTLIASVGLIQNSAAVIIGAMLVAPLMTPMLGLGLAMAQGNPRLVTASARSVFLGMATVFVLAFGLGLVLPGFYEPTPEMLQRNWPSLLDLFVAFVSGLAAAYSSSRANLLAALPGVAIAAALVPPIATSGLAMAVWDHDLARGSMLLFLVNMVAIVAASAMALWAVGVRGSQDGTRVTRIAGWSTILASLTLGVALGLGAPEYEAPVPVPQPLVTALRAHLAPTWRLLELEVDKGVTPPELKIRIGGTESPPAGLAAELQLLVREHVPKPMDVYLRSHWAMPAAAAADLGHLTPSEPEPAPPLPGDG